MKNFDLVVSNREAGLVETLNIDWYSAEEVIKFIEELWHNMDGGNWQVVACFEN